MDKTETNFFIGVVVFLGILIGIGVWLVSIDLSELTSYNYTGVVVDKWHTESCTPIIDGDGNYLGEDCQDIYTAVTNLEDYGRSEITIDYPEFQDLPVGSRVDYSFDRGKLGWKHNERLNVKR